MPPPARSEPRFARNGLIYVIAMLSVLGLAFLLGAAGHGPVWPLYLYIVLTMPASLVAAIVISGRDASLLGVFLFLLLLSPALNLGLLALLGRLGGKGGEEPRRPGLDARDDEPGPPAPPIGATVVVYRYVDRTPEFLLLHRACREPAKGEDWAWAPPAGSRRPGEAIRRCAKRALEEQTGLAPRIRFLDREDTTWALFRAEVPPDVEVNLDGGHDRFEWVSLAEAERRCRPARVAEQVSHVHGVLVR